MTPERIIELGAGTYSSPRQLKTGEWACIAQMVFTWAIMVGVDDGGWRTRFCYDTRVEAEAALEQWDGDGFPPGYWIKQKPENISNPTLEEIDGSR